MKMRLPVYRRFSLHELKYVLDIPNIIKKTTVKSLVFGVVKPNVSSLKYDFLGFL